MRRVGRCSGEIRGGARACRAVAIAAETTDGIMTMSMEPRRKHSAARLRTIAALTVVALLGAGLACRSTPQPNDVRAASRCDTEAPGTLRIANSSGRILEVYVARPSATPQLLAQVSPGTITLSVPGPSDLGVRYDVIDPNAQQLLSTVNWNRRTGRETRVGVVVELTCMTPPDETMISRAC